jgi:hypothetical protein
MKNLLLLLTIFIGVNSIGQRQGDLTIYSNTGDKFYVILNGIRQNKEAETNVKVTGLKDNYYSCKIISGSKNFEIDKNVIVKHDSLVTYRIVEKKGKYKLRFYSETALGTSSSEENQTVIQYHQTPVVEDNSSTSFSSNSNTGATTTTTTTTTSTTSDINTIENGNGSESVNMNINISENGMSANVNVKGTGIEGSEMNTTTNTSTSTTLNGTTSIEETTTTTSSGGNGTTTYYEETTTTTTTTTSGNEGNIYQDQDMTVTMDMDCSTSDQDVINLKKQIEGEAFPDDQQRVANMAAKNKCMTVEQIKEVVPAFTFPDNKLSFLKAAYDNCIDKSNYYQLMDTLTFADDKAELEKFINSK